MLHKFFAREEGQGLVEYSLIIMLIALIAIGSVSSFGLGLADLYEFIVSSWPS